MPYFLPTCPDPDIARAEILETLSSYGARSRSEVINAARIVAYSYASMETLAEARAPDLTPAMRLRHNSNANALNRSCLQNEKTLEKRLAAALPGAGPHEAVSHETASPEVSPPEATRINHLSGADVQAPVQPTEADIAASRDPLATSPSPNPPAQTGRGPITHRVRVTKDMYAELGLSAKNIEAVENAEPSHAPGR